jgi:hypothetical protein
MLVLSLAFTFFVSWERMLSLLDIVTVVNNVSCLASVLIIFNIENGSLIWNRRLVVVAIVDKVLISKHLHLNSLFESGLKWLCDILETVLSHTPMSWRGLRWGILVGVFWSQPQTLLISVIMILKLQFAWWVVTLLGSKSIKEALF